MMAPAGREVDFVGDEIPVPQTVVGAAGGECIALLALLQRLERVTERLFPGFDPGKHFVECADEKTGFAAGADLRADGVILVARDAAQPGRPVARGDWRWRPRDEERPGM